jgi:hypothetical protein
VRYTATLDVWHERIVWSAAEREGTVGWEVRAAAAEGWLAFDDVDLLEWAAGFSRLELLAQGYLRAVDEDVVRAAAADEFLSCSFAHGEGFKG